MSPSFTAAIFYLGAAALVGGTIRSLRSSVEHGRRDSVGLALAAGGAIGLLAAIVAFTTGPRTALPF